MSVKRTIKVKWLRFLKRIGSLNNKVFPNQCLSEAQKKGVKIFEKAVALKEAEIFWHAWSDIIYIEVNDIYFILNGNDLEIINGKFTYYLHFNDKVKAHLKSLINHVLERRVLEIRERIKTKNERTLNSIMDDIIEIKEKVS